MVKVFVKKEKKPVIKKEKGFKAEKPGIKKLNVKKQHVKKEIKTSSPGKQMTEQKTVYVANIPYGFFEEAMTKYFTQFGQVTGVYIPRNDKGRSKGFGFVQFQHPEVAKIAAETMNNYMMMGRLVKASLVDADKQKPWMFKPSRNPKKLPHNVMITMAKTVNRALPEDKLKNYYQRKRNLIHNCLEFLKSEGLNYDVTIVDPDNIMNTYKYDPTFEAKDKKEAKTKENNKAANKKNKVKPESGDSQDDDDQMNSDEDVDDEEGSDDEFDEELDEEDSDDLGSEEESDEDEDEEDEDDSDEEEIPQLVSKGQKRPQPAKKLKKVK